MAFAEPDITERDLLLVLLIKLLQLAFMLLLLFFKNHYSFRDGRLESIANSNVSSELAIL